MKKFFLVAGETSGDFHGSNLVNSIKKVEPNSSFMGHGGDLMKKSGVQILEHIDNLSIMGFTEVIHHLPSIYSIFKKTVSAIERAKPDRIILIDYPGFNLRLSKKIHMLNIPITYFILPQTWAWKKNRVKVIEQYIEQPVSIFSFEKQWYLKNKVNVDFFGHPLIDHKHFDEDSKSFFTRHQLTIEHPILLLLPGSRRQEVDKHWPIYLEVAKKLKNENPRLQFILGKPKWLKINNIPDYIKIENNAKKAMVVSTAGIVASGTATLECAIEELPIVVCYKMSTVSWFLAKILVSLKFSSIVNIIANEKIVPELLQNQMNSKNLVAKIKPLLNLKTNERNQMISKFHPLKDILGKPGVYDRVANSIIKKMNHNK